MAVKVSRKGFLGSIAISEKHYALLENLPSVSDIYTGLRCEQATVTPRRLRLP
jgi:hypothetical protein